MLTDLAHTAFAVHNIDDSLEFYGHLGLTESFRLHRQDGSLMLIYLHVAGDRFIEIFPGGPPPDAERSQSFMHICLLVEDMQATVEHLRGQGVTIERDIAMGLDSNLQAWIRDPDGNAIELMQLDEDSPQRRHARLVAEEAQFQAG